MVCSRLARSFFVLLSLVVATGAAASGQEEIPSGYRLGPKDLLAIQVFEVPELTTDVRVDDNGRINLQHLGEVLVDGLSVTELEARLKELLEQSLLQRASVAVQVKEFRSKPITVIGAVTSPGPLPFQGRVSLLEALTQAGGLTENRGDVVHVLRRAANGLTDQVSISVERLMVVADPKVNIPLLANDLVNVPPAVEVTISCLGEVSEPGALAFKSTDRITLLSAIARAGGLSDRAAKKIKIRRTLRDGTEEILVADYKAILAGRAPDVPLQDGDVIVVEESFF
ncbi:MAG TPA: polysaccharide biosynthesis/export family protein [Thermoanaerobaculia bacterium]|nr:polysaccharide biosynthesis/export family protein [Thermoanaerobaculia bacterium]